MAQKHIQLLLEAAEAVETYKEPEIPEARDFLESILINMGQVGIDRRYINNISVGSESINIDIEWSSRSCDQYNRIYNQHDRIYIPRDIIVAEDPVYAAKKWRIDILVEKANSEYQSALKQLELATNKLETVTKECKEFYK